MSGPQILVQDMEHPERLHMAPNILILTDDTLHGCIRWSRYTQELYVPHHGFLTMHAEQRIKLIVYHRIDAAHPYEQLIDEHHIASELNRYLQPSTCTALHYYPGQCVQSLMTGLPMDTEATLPNAMRTCLPRLTQIVHDV